MAARGLKVEFFFASGCRKCDAARNALREAAGSLPGVQWTEIDIAKNPNRVVETGVLSTPAIAIDGELVFKTAPNATDLVGAIRKRPMRG